VYYLLFLQGVPILNRQQAGANHLNTALLRTGRAVQRLTQLSQQLPTAQGRIKPSSGVVELSQLTSDYRWQVHKDIVLLPSGAASRAAAAAPEAGAG